jgi:DNA-binding transcriptional LysR family regulator
MADAPSEIVKEGRASPLRDLPRMDLKLIQLAYALLTECSVSRAATRTGQTQPSVSIALRRLREIFSDALLVRSGSHLVPTARGVELRKSLARLVDDMEQLFEPVESFDPALLNRSFNVVAANCLGMFLIPEMVRILQREAPLVRLDFRKMPSPEELMLQLETGELDILIGNWVELPKNLRCLTIFTCDIVCVVARDHPFAQKKKVSIEEYLQAEHLSPTPSTDSALSPISTQLATHSLRRRVSVALPEYNIVPYVLPQTGLVFTTGRPFAEHIASQIPVTLVEAPAELGRMRFSVLWHERAHTSAASQWLRNVIRRAASGLTSQRAAVRRKPADMPLSQ